MPRITITPVTSPAELDLAMLIWAAANRTRPRPAGPQRLRRVRERVEQAPSVLLAHYGDRPAGMALAESYRDDAREDEITPITSLPPDRRNPNTPLSRPPEIARSGSAVSVPGPGTGHIAMVAVDPAVWGSGVGAGLVQAIQQQWSQVSVWLRVDNRRAERLFAGRGFTDIGNLSHLQAGEEIRQWVWARPPRVAEPDPEEARPGPPKPGSEHRSPAQTRKSVIVEPLGSFVPEPGSVEETKPSPR